MGILDPKPLTQKAADAAYAKQWKPNTAYTAGQPVINPTGDVVTAKVDFTSGATYNAANWNLSSLYAIPDGTPRLMKNPGDSRAGLIDWEFNAGQAGYLFHLRAGVSSSTDEYALGIGLDGGSGGGILISQKTSGGTGINLGQWPGTGVGILASNRSSIPIMNTEIYAGAGGVIYSLKSGYGRSDGVLTAGSPIMTSATANFTSADIGRTITTTQPKPNDLPAGTTIVSVESTTSVTLSQNATATRTGVRFMISGRTAAATQTLLRFYDTDTTNDLFAIRQGSIMTMLPFLGKDAGSTVLRVNGQTGQVADLQSWRDVNTTKLSRINKDGRIMSSRNTLPAVADLDNGEWTLHGDPTTGAEKFYVTIKNNAGNLVTKDLTL